jgi:hypothetical protein
MAFISIFLFMCMEVFFPSLFPDIMLFDRSGNPVNGNPGEASGDTTV